MARLHPGAWIVTACLAAAAAAAGGDTAEAHDFYDYVCCHDRDCRPIAFDDVRVTPQGYVLVRTGTVIPFGDSRIRMTPAEDIEQRYHLCTTTGKMTGMILCLYVPQGGV